MGGNPLKNGFHPCGMERSKQGFVQDSIGLKMVILGLEDVSGKGFGRSSSMKAQVIEFIWV